MMKDKLTLVEAYKAMYTFLDSYYFQMNEPDEVGALLGDLRILPDGKPVDPAAWDDWLKAVQKALDSETESNTRDESN
jgi:hypothetical protein